MTVPFQLTPQATEDIDAIWWTIAADNRTAADRVEMEILATCRRLAKHPRIGTKRQDITMLPVRFWTVTRFPNYVIVYRPETVPIRGCHPAREARLEKHPGTTFRIDSASGIRTAVCGR